MKYITCTDSPEVFGSEFDGDPSDENDAVAEAAEAAGIRVIRGDDSFAVLRDAEALDGTEIDWFSQWCKNKNTNWTKWFAARR